MQLFYLFFYTSALALLSPPFLSVLPPASFAPFLSICFYRCKLIAVLWWALACGLIVDLFSADTPIGTTAANYCVVSIVFYRYQFHFFEDRISTLSVLSFIFSFFSNFIKILTNYFLGKPFLLLSWGWLFDEFFIYPWQAALYALLAFTLPLLFIFSLKKRGLFAKKRRRHA